MGVLGLLGGVGGCWRAVRGHQGFWGVRGVLGMASGLGAQLHWAPVQGPSTPTGSSGGVTYLAKAKQVTENELCRLLYTFGTIFCDSFHISIYATSSHILTCNIKKCLHRLFSLQTNLCISLHHQSDIL